MEKVVFDLFIPIPFTGLVIGVIAKKFDAYYTIRNDGKEEWVKGWKINFYITKKKFYTKEGPA